MRLQIAVASVVFLSTSLSLASTPSFRYLCRDLGGANITEKIEVSATQMAMYDQADGAGRGIRGTVIFDNRGLQGGTGKMKDRFNFTVNYDKSQVHPGEISTYFLSPELATGGFPLKNGSQGGFLSFAGHGYSWETYICFRAK